MRQQENIRIECGSLLVSRNMNAAGVVLSKSTSTQATSLTTGISVSTNAGFIYTFTTGTLATLGSTSFTVSNPSITENSLIALNLNGHGGNGVPQVSAINVTQGSFGVRIRNLDATNAMSGSLKLGYNIQ